MNGRYNWKEWFGRERFALVAGVDYRCSTATMIQNVRNRASRLGLHIRVVETEGGFTVLRAPPDVEKPRSKRGARRFNNFRGPICAKTS